MSDLEAMLLYHWRILGGAPLVREHRFALPRKWRLDFAHLPTRVAIEVDGGTWSGGRHVRGAGYEQDAIKANSALAAGWLVFRVTGGMLRKDPVGCLTPIIETIRQRERDASAAASTHRAPTKGGRQ